MFGYASGPAYGRLLDGAAPGWREGLEPDSDLGALLGAAAGITAPEDPVAVFSRTAALYDGQAVAEEELAAHRERGGLMTLERAAGGRAGAANSASEHPGQLRS